ASMSATSSYDFNLGTHSLTTTESGIDLVLSASSSAGVWISPALYIGSNDFSSTSIIRWATSSPGGTTVTFKTAVNSSGTSSPTASAFATSTNGGSVAGLPWGLTGK